MTCDIYFPIRFLSQLVSAIFRPLSAMLPMMGRGNAKQLVNMNVIGDDGPTVRQHLQQQQQKARLQQQLAMQAKQKAEEAAKQNVSESYAFRL